MRVPSERVPMKKFHPLVNAAALVALFVGCPQAADLPWLVEVQRPPAAPPAGAPALAPILSDAAGKAIDSADAWRARREEIRKGWLDFLGRFPEERPPVALTVLEEDRAAGCLRQLVRYEAEPGCPVEGYLLAPLEVKGR